MKRATILAHEEICAVVSLGDIVIDATVGNGHDAVFLAQLVGEKGCVFGFDIQAEAIASARQRLKSAGLSQRVTLIEASHSEMKSHVKEPVSAVMFNLGYLPGGDQKKMTQTQSTLEALEAALDSLSVSGILTCVCYPGHPGGFEECEAVIAWARDVMEVTTSDEVKIPDKKDRSAGRPFLVTVKKRSV